MRENTMDKNTIRETVRMIASDMLENYITVNNEMITVVGGKFLLRKYLAGGSYVLTINAEKLFCEGNTG